MKNNRGSISLLEMIVIPLLVLEGLYLLYAGYGWYHRRVARGDDALKLNTCESVAKVNSLNGVQCPVNGCSGQDCVHHIDGGYIGYYDNVSNTIIADKPEGYNESTVLKIGDQTYNGKPGTLVIEVKVVNGTLQYRWVKGRNG